jgi:hypothetical protein
MLFRQATSHMRHFQFIKLEIQATFSMVPDPLHSLQKPPVKPDSNSFTNFSVVSINFNIQNESPYLFL